MSKALRLITIAAATALALPALAGSWPPIAPRKAANTAATTTRVAPAKAPDAARSVNGFEPVAGEAGWQLSQHKYVYAGGKWRHSDECDHVIRSASVPTPADIERNRTFSPGA